jgi:hypothetical protein
VQREEEDSLFTDLPGEERKYEEQTDDEYAFRKKYRNYLNNDDQITDDDDDDKTTDSTLGVSRLCGLEGVIDHASTYKELTAWIGAKLQSLVPKRESPAQRHKKASLSRQYYPNWSAQPTNDFDFYSDGSGDESSTSSTSLSSRSSSDRQRQRRQQMSTRRSQTNNTSKSSMQSKDHQHRRESSASKKKRSSKDQQQRPNPRFLPGPVFRNSRPPTRKFYT